MNITYDLKGARPKEKFRITANIFNEAGDTIQAITFRGAIGENISAGHWINTFFPEGIFTAEGKKKSTRYSQKRIFWEISKDMVELDEKIFVELSATHTNPGIIRPTGTAKALVLSSVCPGWGSCKTTLRTNHVFRGLAGYLCIAGSLYSNSLSENSYSDYLSAGSGHLRDILYEKTERQFATSRLLLYTAGAIWLLDYVNILTADNNSGKSGYRSQLTILKGYNKISNYYPGLSLVYNF